jgi:hypothetical protein
MPFPQPEYEIDFGSPEELTEFRDLLAQAREHWLALDGDRGWEMNRSYEAVGRYVVRRCDMLVAISDGGPSSGRSGKVDIVRYAATQACPCGGLHATEDRSPVWITDVLNLRYPRPSADHPETLLRAI